jgi:hypothetical protein
MDSYNFPPLEELTFPTTWEPNDKEGSILAEDEALDDVQQWRNSILGYNHDNAMQPSLGSYDDDEEEDDGDGIFGGASCDSPTGPFEELEMNAPLMLLLDTDGTSDGYNTDMMMDDDKDDASITAMPFEKRYKATLEKLAESMKRSQETRNCLTMKTIRTESYGRLESVKEIVSAIATSSSQVQNYVTSIQKQV